MTYHECQLAFGLHKLVLEIAHAAAMTPSDLLCAVLI